MKTRDDKRTRGIRLVPVSARPCERIPGGTVLAKMVCPSFEEPVGWIVRSPAQPPPDDASPAKTPDVWHFLPTCGVDPTLSDFAGQGPLQIAVRLAYRGIYDRKPSKHRKRIAKGDDCEIGNMVLEWCGLSKFWDEHDLGYDYSVIHNVLPDCRSIVYWSREWENGPGLSGDMYYVETEDATCSVREIRKITETLLAEMLAKPPPPPPPPKKRRKPAKKKSAQDNGAPVDSIVAESDGTG